MKAFVKRQFLFELLSDVVDYILTQTVGNKKLLEIKRIHVPHLNASYRDGNRLGQRHAEQWAACDVGETVIGFQELQHREKMRIGLNLIEKDQCVFLVAQPAFGDRTQTKIEVLRSFGRLKETRSISILQQIDFDVVVKHLPPNMAYDKWLPDLTGTINNQNLVRLVLAIVSDFFFYFSE